jgi:hypothetical protein
MAVDVPRDPREAARSAKLFRKMLRIVAGLQAPQKSSYEQRKWFIQGERAAVATLRHFDKLGFVGNFDRGFEDESSLATWFISVVDSMPVPEDYLVVERPQTAPSVFNVWPGRKACVKFTQPTGFGGTCNISDDELLLGHQAPMSERGPNTNSQIGRSDRITPRTLPDGNVRLTVSEPMIQDLIRSLQALNLEPDRSVVQFDCGEGDLLCRLCVEAGCSGIGVDRHAATIKEAERRSQEAELANVKFRRVALRERHDLSSCGAVLAFLPREKLWSLAETTLQRAKVQKDTPVFVFNWAAACGDLLGLTKVSSTASGLTCLLHAGGRPIRPPAPIPKLLAGIIQPPSEPRRQKKKPRLHRVSVRQVAEEAHKKYKKEQSARGSTS